MENGSKVGSKKGWKWFRSSFFCLNPDLTEPLKIMNLSLDLTGLGGDLNRDFFDYLSIMSAFFDVVSILFHLTRDHFSRKIIFLN